MGTERNVYVIEIEWDGPFSIDALNSLNGESDFGVYQVYGTHVVFGSDALLYIGKAEEQYFSRRMAQHTGWFGNEPSQLTLYVGRLGSETGAIGDGVWKEEINRAERVLIHSCSPPYNTQHLNTYGSDVKSLVVLNRGKRHRLPAIVSTLYQESIDRFGWKRFTWSKPFDRASN